MGIKHICILYEIGIKPIYILCEIRIKPIYILYEIGIKPIINHHLFIIGQIVERFLGYRTADELETEIKNALKKIQQ